MLHKKEGGSNVRRNTAEQVEIRDCAFATTDRPTCGGGWKRVESSMCNAETSPLLFRSYGQTSLCGVTVPSKHCFYSERGNVSKIRNWPNARIQDLSRLLTNGNSKELLKHSSHTFYRKKKFLGRRWNLVSSTFCAHFELRKDRGGGGGGGN